MPNQKEIQNLLEESKQALEDAKTPPVFGTTMYYYESIAKSLLVIASILADMEFKDEG